MRVLYHRDEQGKLKTFTMPDVLRKSNDGEFPDGQMLKATVDDVEVHVLAPSYMNADELEASLTFLDGLAERTAREAIQ